MKIKSKKLVLESESGGKITISFDTGCSPEDIIDVISKFQEETSSPQGKSLAKQKKKLDQTCAYDSFTIREKLESVVDQIKYGWFTSDHVRELYQYNFHKDIKPSTVSTYLARMFDENTLERRGSRARREYRLAEKEVAPIECF
ncbi:MAG: hypothetical protein ACTSQI_11430 [Candidatus Helarchaeota archaeon]